jgi:hypothetical protein
MSDARFTCLSDETVLDYWTEDIDAAARDRVEVHIFECASCAARLSDAEALARAVSELVRHGRVHAFVTDETLNRLAHDGTRVRHYIVEPGAALHCAIWEEDEVIVARLKADLSGVSAVDAAMRLEGGELLDEVSDIPVGVDASDLLMALPASLVMALPAERMRLTLTASDAANRRVVAEYVFDHQGVGRRT